MVEWLLDPVQPSIRYRTMVELLGRSPSDREVEAARRRIPITGWGADILQGRDEDGWWTSSGSLYRPKYVATTWQLIVLSDLGLTRVDPRIAASCELWMRRTAAKGGGVGGNSVGTPHHCLAGNMARSLIQFGYVDDPRIVHTMEWLAATADPKGGWSCFGRGRNLDSWEGLSAFAVYPRDRWTRAMATAVERGVEFYLERELHRQGSRYAPWYRFHYPTHYYYDLLLGLEILGALGHGSDARLRAAIHAVQRRRRPDGRWNLDAVHPDVGPTMERWYRSHPNERPTPLAFEAVGRPSRMITLRALLALRRTEDGDSPRAG